MFCSKSYDLSFIFIELRKVLAHQMDVLFNAFNPCMYWTSLTLTCPQVREWRRSVCHLHSCGILSSCVYWTMKLLNRRGPRMEPWGTPHPHFTTVSHSSAPYSVLCILYPHFMCFLVVSMYFLFGLPLCLYSSCKITIQISI